MFEKLVHLALVFALSHSFAQTSEAETQMPKPFRVQFEYQDTNKAMSKLIAEIEALAKMRDLEEAKINLPEHAAFVGTVIKTTPLHKTIYCDICRTVCNDEAECSFVMYREPCYIEEFGYVIEYTNRDLTAEFFSINNIELGTTVFP